MQLPLLMLGNNFPISKLKCRSEYLREWNLKRPQQFAQVSFLTGIQNASR